MNVRFTAPMRKVSLGITNRLQGARRFCHDVSASIQQMGFDMVAQNFTPAHPNTFQVRSEITEVRPQIVFSVAADADATVAEDAAASTGTPVPPVPERMVFTPPPPPAAPKINKLRLAVIIAGPLQLGFSAVSIPMLAALVLPISAPAALAWMVGGALSLLPTGLAVGGYFLFRGRRSGQEQVAPPTQEPAAAAEPDALEAAAEATRPAVKTYEQTLDGLAEAIRDLRTYIDDAVHADSIGELQGTLEAMARTQGLLIEAEDKGGRTQRYIIFPETGAPGEDLQRAPLIPQGRLLGQGGMADVFGAIEISSGRLVAVKYLAESDYRDRFEAEAKNMMETENSGVVEVYSRRGGNYFVMEYMDPRVWPSLKNYLAQQRGALDPVEAVRIAIRLCEVMGTLGSIHHRDIKPGNIFVYPEREGIKLADFGLAKFPGEGGPDTATGIVGGTHPYMAPYFAGEYGRRSRAARRRESAHMRAILTKNDLFAIGATLYKLLTGHNPTWDGGGKPFRVTNNPQAASEVGLVHILQDYTEYMAAKRAGDAPKMDEIKARYTLVNAFPSQGIIIADPIFEVLSKMMAFDAEDTYANFIDARHALELALTGLAIGDRLPEAGEEEDSGTHSVLTGDLEVVEDAAEEDDDGSVSLGPVLDGVPGVDEVDADELVAAAEEAAEEATAAAADDSVPPPTPPGALDEPSELTSGAAQVIEPVTRDELQGILFGGVAFPEDVPFTVERISAYLGSHPEDAGLAMAAINYVTNPANNPEGGQ